MQPERCLRIWMLQTQGPSNSEFWSHLISQHSEMRAPRWGPLKFLLGSYYVSEHWVECIFWANRHKQRPWLWNKKIRGLKIIFIHRYAEQKPEQAKANFWTSEPQKDQLSNTTLAQGSHHPAWRSEGLALNLRAVRVICALANRIVHFRKINEEPEQLFVGYFLFLFLFQNWALGTWGSLKLLIQLRNVPAASSCHFFFRTLQILVIDCACLYNVQAVVD